jgi:hypothetical protein
LNFFDFVDFLGLFGTFRDFFELFGLFGTFWDFFRLPWTALDDYGQLWTYFELFWTTLGLTCDQVKINFPVGIAAQASEEPAKK